MSKTQSNNNYNNNGDVNQNVNKNTSILIGGKNNIIFTIVIKVSIIMVIGIFIIFGLNAFLNTNEKKIIGTRQINEQPQILITFGNDGAFSMSGDGDYLDGNYTFLTDNTVQAHMNYMWADFVISGDISISGNKMTISNMRDPDDIFGANGATITLSKTK